MAKLVLLRHGQSTWNKENRFTGWVDVDLTPEGAHEALQAGQMLSAEAFNFGRIHTSYLKRAIKTLHIVLEELNLLWMPVYKSWRLNERHYGALQGLNKKETADKHGEEQVKIWRRSYATLPPQLTKDDDSHPLHDPKYAGVPRDLLPSGESLKLTVDRVLPYWEEAVAPDLKSGKDVLIVAHGNSLRALVQHLDKMSEEKILALNIPTGRPLVYEFNDAGNVVGSSYLGDEDEIRRAQEEVAGQGKA